MHAIGKQTYTSISRRLLLHQAENVDHQAESLQASPIIVNFAPRICAAELSNLIVARSEHFQQFEFLLLMPRCVCCLRYVRYVCCKDAITDLPLRSSQNVYRSNGPLHT